MSKTTLSLPCPSCSKTVMMTEEYPFRPFCSKRCRLIDLGEWASEGHRIVGGEGEPEDGQEHWSGGAEND